jgi:hypothetical protein
MHTCRKFAQFWQAIHPDLLVKVSQAWQGMEDSLCRSGKPSVVPGVPGVGV